MDLHFQPAIQNALWKKGQHKSGSADTREEPITVTQAKGSQLGQENSTYCEEKCMHSTCIFEIKKAELDAEDGSGHLPGGGERAMKPWILSSWHLNFDGVPCRETPSKAFVRVSSQGHMVANICKRKVFVYTF